MTKLKIALVFISLYGLRYLSIPSPLPESWTPESKIRFTATITEQPEYSDSKTIIRQGMWYLSIPGYAEIIPGSRIAFVGKIEPKLLGGKVVRIIMMDPIFEVVLTKKENHLSIPEKVVIGIQKFRLELVAILEKTLPEPMSSLSAGILLGVRAQMPREFYDALVSTGTLHVVAASGFNVMIVATILMSLFGRVLSRGKAIGAGVAGILFYVVLSGASASVVRAGIMGSLTLTAYYFGREAQARRLLWVTSGIMLLVSPLMIFDIGFQLSVVATAGILYIGPMFSNLAISNIGIRKSKILKDYLYPTLSASAATAPIILFHFGRVSWISPLVNVLILPVVPLIMLLSAIQVGIGMLSLDAAQIVAWINYLPLWWIVRVVLLADLS